MAHRHRVAVVGAGGISAAWFPALLERADVEIVAVVEKRSSRAQALLSKYELSVPLYEGVEGAIKEMAPTVVVDLTPPAHHREVVGAALDMGCHVLGEKPMAATLPEALELVALAEASDRVYAVMQQRRYGIGIRAVRDAIAAGTIGRPEHVSAAYFMSPHFGGFRHEMENPLLLEMAIHTFDEMRFMVAFEPLFVYCHEFSPRSSQFRGAAAAECIFECADGAVFSYTGSWAAAGFGTAWASEWRVVGERGTIVWDGAGMPYGEVGVEPVFRGEVLWPAESVELPRIYSGREGHAGCIDDFLAAIEEGTRPETLYSDNIKSIVMVFAAIESARRRRRVEIATFVNEASVQGPHRTRRS